MPEKPKKIQLDGRRSLVEKRQQQAWEEDKAIVRAKRAKRLREQSNLGERFKRRTFDSFNRAINPDAYDKSLRYSDHYRDSERNSLLIIGPVGTGKTHLAAAISNKLMDNGIPVLFDTFNGHLNKLKNDFDANKKDGHLKMMQEVEMLVIDDAGKEKQTTWSESVMFDVINYRYEHMLPVIITSNLSKNDLKHYLGEASWSRLCEMCEGIITIGQDQRMR